jgi:hypothetical protein
MTDRVKIKWAGITLEEVDIQPYDPELHFWEDGSYKSLCRMAQTFEPVVNGMDTETFFHAENKCEDCERILKSNRSRTNEQNNT